MRIVSGSTDIKVPFVALDPASLAEAAGLSSFTVWLSRNGGTYTVMPTPTVSEMDSTNGKGDYWLLLDESTTIDAGHDSEILYIRIKEAGMKDVRLAVELYRPETTKGSTLTVQDVTDIKVKTDQLTYSITDTLDANVQYVNSVQLFGDGSALTPWGP